MSICHRLWHGRMKWIQYIQYTHIYINMKINIHTWNMTDRDVHWLKPKLFGIVWWWRWLRSLLFMLCTAVAGAKSRSPRDCQAGPCEAVCLIARCCWLLLKRLLVLRKDVIVFTMTVLEGPTTAISCYFKLFHWSCGGWRLGRALVFIFSFVLFYCHVLFHYPVLSYVLVVFWAIAIWVRIPWESKPQQIKGLLKDIYAYLLLPKNGSFMSFNYPGAESVPIRVSATVDPLFCGPFWDLSARK